MPRRQNEEYQYAVRRILQEKLFNLKVNDPGQNEFVKKRLKTLHAFLQKPYILLDSYMYMYVYEGGLLADFGSS